MRKNVLTLPAQYLSFRFRNLDIQLLEQRLRLPESCTRQQVAWLPCGR